LSADEFRSFLPHNALAGTHLAVPFIEVIKAKFRTIFRAKGGSHMEAIMTQVTTSISEFKKNPNESVAQAGNRAFAVLTNNKPSFYVVPPELYEKIADIIFDLELAPKLKKRMSEKGKAVKVKIEEL